MEMAPEARSRCLASFSKGAVLTSNAPRPPIYYGHVKKTTISDSEDSSDDEDEVETTRNCDLFSDEPAAPLANPGAGDQGKQSFKHFTLAVIPAFE